MRRGATSRIASADERCGDIVHIIPSPMQCQISFMRCYIYKSQAKADTYVYLRERDAFHLLPPAVLEPLGALAFVMDIHLSPERRLARETATVVMEHLERAGFHLQLPPPRVAAGPLSIGEA
jgi:uncharacterized protein YcgL (UPF0745 family)